MEASPPLLPRLRLVLAISLDGRLAPPGGGAAQIGGRGDRRVLEEALAWADAALLGAETLRRHGSTCLLHAPDLLARRRLQQRPEQPLALVASRGAGIPADLPFFCQPLERWLLLAQVPEQATANAALPSLSAATAEEGAFRGPQADGPAITAATPLGFPGRQPAPAPGCRVGKAMAVPAGFARVMALTAWETTLRQLAEAGLERLVVLGGAALAGSLLEENRIDELQLTLCPRLLGGEHTWLGSEVALSLGARDGWRLLEQRRLEGDELLLRYGRAPAAG